MKYLKYFGIAAIILGFLFSMAYYIQTNSRSAITYETTTLSKQTIEEKIVATGSVVPEDEVNIVPQISGIIDEIFVEEGDEVVAGDLLAKIKVVPNEQSLNSAEGRVKTSRIVLNNSTKEYNRNKKLFDKERELEEDQKNIFLGQNEPRIYSVSSKGNEDKVVLNKAIFTSCKNNNNCPAWSIKADKITHDRVNQNIHYKNAILNIYDMPVFYFPKFFHQEYSRQ